MKKSNLEALLTYMYVGEVNVKKNELPGLIKAAESLRIKGLAFPVENSPDKSGFLQSKKKVSNNSNHKNIDNTKTGESVDKPRLPLKRKKRGSAVNEVSDENNPSTPITRQKSSSYTAKRKKLSDKQDLKPKILSVYQIKTQTDDFEEDGQESSNLENDDNVEVVIEKVNPNDDQDQISSFDYPVEPGTSGLPEDINWPENESPFKSFGNVDQDQCPKVVNTKLFFV